MFQPAIPVGGYLGWKVFERGLERQRDAFATQESVQRNLAYFRENIGDVADTAALVADRRLLAVALGAFGLEDEINKKALIRRVLDEGTSDPRSFANRMNDRRWKQFAETFAPILAGIPAALGSSYLNGIANKFIQQSFERSVGEADADIRLALNFRREAKEIASGPNVDRVGWLQIMGQRPLRAVVEAAFGLPASIGQLDIDRQRTIFEEKAEKLLGSKSASAFLDDANIERAIRVFFARQSASSAPSSVVPGQAALMLLGNAASSGAAVGLILSNASRR